MSQELITGSRMVTVAPVSSPVFSDGTAITHEEKDLLYQHTVSNFEKFYKPHETHQLKASVGPPVVTYKDEPAIQVSKNALFRKRCFIMRNSRKAGRWKNSLRVTSFNCPISARSCFSPRRLFHVTPRRKKGVQFLFRNRGKAPNTNTEQSYTTLATCDLAVLTALMHTGVRPGDLLSGRVVPSILQSDIASEGKQITVFRLTQNKSGITRDFKNPILVFGNCATAKKGTDWHVRQDENTEVGSFVLEDLADD
jgi:hypothetical protein